MKTKYKIGGLLLASLLLTACGGSSGEEERVLVGETKCVVSDTDKETNQARVHILSDIARANYVFANKINVPLISGTAQDGYILLDGGKYQVKVCEDEREKYCGRSSRVLVSTNLQESLYKRHTLEGKTGGMSTNNQKIIYGTRTGEIYSLDLKSDVSTYLFDMGSRIGGVAHIKGDTYYVSSTTTGAIYKIDIKKSQKKEVGNVTFPDGLDFYNSKLYSVTNDVSGLLTIFNDSEEKIGRFSTGITDIVGIAHSKKFLYILSEDGNIFQLNATTGKSEQIFNNDNLFTKGNNYNGLEAITIVNNKIYVSYIDNETLYEINLNLEDYE